MEWVRLTGSGIRRGADGARVCRMDIAPFLVAAERTL
jgi:hypothetical protein